ncbi:RNase P Rpr2/Rpp21 subunit domain-containing protein [Trifolium repens]|nr:RNase P Rpr2/Rpp21 subunit domain-containing protein [Trifolium repens]
MGKKGGAKKLPKSESKFQNPITLREEATGKLKTKPIVNIKSHLRIDHLKKLAVWATTEPHIPSLSAFYGQHLATVSEAAGVPPDPSLITCQRCETILHPGFNSTVRIEKNRSKAKHRNKKYGSIAQNNVVYNCHFCSHKNLKRGTPKGHLKKICPTKDKPSLESTPATKPIVRESSKLEKHIVSKDEAGETHSVGSEVVVKDVTRMVGPDTTPSTSTPTLLEGKKRSISSSTFKNTFETPSKSAKVDVAKTQSKSSKRRKKSWTSLKEIAQNKEREVANLTIPFFL